MANKCLFCGDEIIDDRPYPARTSIPKLYCMLACTHKSYDLRVRKNLVGLTDEQLKLRDKLRKMYNVGVS